MTNPLLQRCRVLACGLALGASGGSLVWLAIVRWQAWSLVERIVGLGLAGLGLAMGGTLLATVASGDVSRRQLKRYAAAVTGVGLILIGIAGLVLPILQGWVTIFAGLGVLASEFPLARRFLHRIGEGAEIAARKLGLETLARKWMPRLRPWVDPLARKLRLSERTRRRWHLHPDSDRGGF